MKNYYELKSEEKEKFWDEFNELEYTKNINCNMSCILITIIISFIIIIISEVTPDIEFLKVVSNIFELIISFVFFAYVIEYVKKILSFIRWLKIKHKIDS